MGKVNTWGTSLWSRGHELQQPDTPWELPWRGLSTLGEQFPPHLVKQLDFPSALRAHLHMTNRAVATSDSSPSEICWLSQHPEPTRPVLYFLI